MSRLTALLVALLLVAPAAADGNRLAHLDRTDPYYVGRSFPKLVTPQWVGEDGVEAAVVLAIDDMRGPDKWETFLRPILERLKRIDGRAAASIMTCQIDPKHPHLQTWLKEGVSLECHTIDHPCPMLKGGDLAAAKATYDRCVDLLADVPNNRPVAFRTPCCDSLNTPSPRLFAEIFNKTTPRGRFLSLDSSIFNVFTADDPALPREVVLDPDGRERFRKYLPADRSFANTIEDYPYPFVLNGLCWEFPCVTPSDWQAQHLQRPNNPATVRDWQAALDATVIKQGVFCLVFHPHGWIRNDQVVELIDYAQSRYGKRVKFLTFKEAEERLTKNLLGGVPLRGKDGNDNGVRLLDLDGDGYLDVVFGGRRARLWEPHARSWRDSDVTAVAELRRLAGAKALVGDEKSSGLVPPNVLFRDLDGDGRCELIVARPDRAGVFAWSAAEAAWKRLPFGLPSGAPIVDAPGRDAGLRLVDIDGDGHPDVIWSNETSFGLYLFADMKTGWSRKVLSGKPGDANALPLISRNGTDNGAWFHSRHLWVQNENTALLKDHVDRRAFNDLLSAIDPPAKSPAESLHMLRPRPGFVAELVAAEPVVEDPIAFAWGPDGKFWVVEMGDYPLGTDGKGRPGGRVKVLSEPDEHGRYRKATVFLDNLPFPTGVLPWRNGVLITCAPDIFYAEDTDGDGKADKRVTLLTGFAPGNQQHRVNGLTWGLDNWVYGANGDSGGRVRVVNTLTPGPSPAKPGEGRTVDIRGHDFRFRPDTGEFEVVTGQSQYGRCQDDWGDWFGGNNSNPLWHYPLPDHYLRRNPHLAPPDPRVTVPTEPGLPRVYPISRTLPRFNDLHAANRFTSACSPTVYRDDLFGPHFVGTVFVCEPVHDLVSRLVLSPAGGTFRGTRAAGEEQSEFLASADNWCRPVFVRTGPDGAVWVSDMYRYVIEHPQWIPVDWQKRLDLRAGHDLGRIYRIAPVAAERRPVPRLDQLDTARLVAALDSPSGWQRDMAQQLLIWRNDRAAVGPLESMVGLATRPQTRLHALCTLAGLGALRPEVVRPALADAHPGVRRHAVRLIEPALATAPELGTALLPLVNDADAQVRLQLALALGDRHDPRAGTALAELAARAVGDPYLTAAVLSSVNKDNLRGVTLAIVKHGRDAALIAELLRQADAFGDARTTADLLAEVTRPADGRYAAWQFAALAGLLDGLDRRGGSALPPAAELFAAARTIAADSAAPPPDRAAAVRLLGRGPDHRAEDLQQLETLLVPQVPEEVQSAAIAGLARQRTADVAAHLLRGWRGYGPAVRAQVLEALSRRDDWFRAALDAVEHGDLPAAEVDAARRQQWLRYRNANLRGRAERLLGGAANPDRQKVIDAYADALTRTGDPARGQPLFTRHCATCHKLGGTGGEVGPDLTALTDKPADYLLTAILDPNRAVEPRYVAYVADLKNGQQLTGVLAESSGNRVTLVGTDGKPQTVLRSDLASLESTGRSAMPEGLEKDLSPRNLADLIAYLRTR
ncbi:MAG TPA: PVC-type heme-binding CxxCH protein [Gemmataceae bacterium]|jgi:putative membrane-bound dehydrogenase-like protein